MHTLLLMAAFLATDKVVLVTATSGFRHDSIANAEQLIGDLATPLRFEVTYVRDEDAMGVALTPEALRGVRLVIFANTTGNLKPEIRDGLLAWVRTGGSFVGAHSASDTWHESPEYVEMLGGEFETHPDQMNGTIVIEDRDHPSTAPLPSPHVLFEEYYVFKNFHRDRVRLLLTLDGAAPLAWHKSYGAGRVFYTALGHREDVWTSPWFRQHLSGGIAWALERETVTPRRRAVRK